MTARVSKKRISELHTMRSQLQHELVRLEDEVGNAQLELAESANRDDRIAEMAASAQDQKLDVTLEEHLTCLLQRVDYAINSIDDGTYGKCVSCGKRIPRERLDAVPYADRCVECQRREEKR